MTDMQAAICEYNREFHPRPSSQCTCDLTTGCDEDDDTRCWVCRTIDPYEPCPVFGFMCDPVCGDPDDPCCTPEQREMTRQLRVNA